MILAETSPTFLQNRSPDTIENIYYNSYRVDYMLSLLWWLSNQFSMREVQVRISGLHTFSLVKFFAWIRNAL